MKVSGGVAAGGYPGRNNRLLMFSFRNTVPYMVIITTYYLQHRVFIGMPSHSHVADLLFAVILVADGLDVPD
jgi:hypothetical protein